MRRAVAVVCAVLCPVLASAQQAQLTGAVRDTQSAAITKAKATLTESATGVVLTADADSRGMYVFASVKPGAYQLDVTADGFAKFTQYDLDLHVDQRAVLNITLTVGAQNESITVSGVRPLLGRADGSVGTVIDRRLAESLPMRGRSFSSLIALVPGVVYGPTNSDEASEFRVNGQRTASNTLLVDGVNAPSEMGINGVQAGGGQRFSTTVTGSLNGGVSYDAVQEVHVQTSSFAAEFGRTPGAQISLVTRSGTNKLNASIFGQLRNDKMSANDWFANSRNTPKPESKERQFGAAVGGPIVRSQLFFFATYEGLRLNQPSFTQGSVPSLEARQQPSPVSRAFNVYPLPTGPTRPDGTAEYASFDALRHRADTWSARLDQAIGRLQLFGRFSAVPSKQESEHPFVTESTLNQGARNLTSGMTLPIGDRTLIEIRGNVTQADYETRKQTQLKEFFPDSIPSTAGISFGGGSLSTIQTGDRTANLERGASLIGSLSHVRGAHQIKVGFDHRRVWSGEDELYVVSLRIGSVPQALLGASATTSVTYRRPTHATFQYSSLYVQDSWRLRPRFSLMYGLRWDVNPAPSFRENEGPLAVTTFEPLNMLKVSSRRNVPLWKTDYLGLFPRAGFSYSLDSDAKTVLSGGGGIFGDLGTPAATQAARGAVGATATVNATNVGLPLTPDAVRAPENSILPPYLGTLLVVDPNLGIPRSTQWNLTLQRALGSKHDVSLGYVGASGRNLLQHWRYSAGLSDFGGPLFVVQNGGRARHRSLQLRYRGRPLSGIESLASYTLGESRETEPRIGFGNRSPVLSPSGSDVRHVLNAAVTWNMPNIGSGSLSKLWNGWGLNLVATARSGYPFSVRSTDFASVAGQEILPERFASLVPGVPIVLEDATAPGGSRLNRAAFTDPPSGEQGNTTLNQFRGFGAQQVDIGLQRSIALGDLAKMRFRVEAFNAFNIPTFSDPNVNLRSANFGVPTTMRASGLSSLYRAGGPRTIAVSMRVEY